jgi:hypothetical protein
MQAITTIGLDIAKSVFQLHGIDTEGKVIVRRQLKRRYVLASIPPEAAAVPGWYRSLRLVASLVARTPGSWPHCSLDAAGVREALCEAA